MRSIVFVVPTDEFNTVIDENIGFRYRNAERVQYFPNWNPCPKDNRNKSKMCEEKTANCMLEQNFCHECCNGSFINGTYLLPPGMLPLVCFPGRNASAPFTAVISPPYFSYSPKEVMNSISGFPQDAQKLLTFKFTRDPASGFLLEVDVNLMISIPMFHTNAASIAAHLPNLMMPMFRMSAHGEIQDFVFQMLYTAFVLIPKCIAWIRIVSLIIAFILFILVAFIVVRQRRMRSSV